jgi:phosphate transport system permease protein
MFFIIVAVIFIIYRLALNFFLAKVIDKTNIIPKAKYFGYFVVLWCCILSIFIFVVYKLLFGWVVETKLLNYNNIYLNTNKEGQALKGRSLFAVKEQVYFLAKNLQNNKAYNIDNFNSSFNKENLLSIAKQYNYYKKNGNYIVFAITLLLLFLAFLILVKSLKHNHNFSKKIEEVVKIVLFIFTTIAVLTTISIVVSLFLESLHFFKEVPVFKFLFGTKWAPEDSEIDINNSFGIIPLLSGTLLIAFVATIVSGFIGVLSAVYMVEYMSKGLRKIVKPTLEVLAGIPSIVYGFFAAIYFAPLVVQFFSFFNITVYSENALSAGIIIGVMITPFVSSISDDTISSVPKSIKEGALAMGSLKNEVIRKVILPSSMPGILGGILLALSRAIGETMVVVMASSLAANLTFNPLEPVTTITTQIAMLLQGDQEFNSPQTLSAFALGFVLLIITLILNIVAIRIVNKYKKRY